MKIVNLTGHPLLLGYSAEELQPDGRGARVHGEMRPISSVLIEGPPEIRLPILEVTENKINGLPRPHEGVLYVVSGIVASHAMREDVVAPGRVERGPDGRARRCHAFLTPRRS